MYSKEEAKKLKTDFWTLFGARSKYALSMEGRTHWIMYQTSIPGLELKFDVSQHNVKTMIELNSKNEDTRLRYFEVLQQYRLMLEQDFDTPFVWDFVCTTSSGNDVCRIYTELVDVDTHKKEDWPTIFDFMTSTMVRLENNFIEIWDVLKEELK